MKLVQDNDLRDRLWGKQGSPQMKQRKGQQTNNGLRPSLHKLFGISKLINFFTKLAYFKQQLGEKNLAKLANFVGATIFLG